MSCLARVHFFFVFALFRVGPEQDLIRLSWLRPSYRASTDQGRGEAGLATSGCYTIPSIREGCSYIVGSPQNTLVPSIADLADKYNVFMAGEEFESGQIKMESALVEFLVGAGIKPECTASYDHFGNNDGRGTDFESTEDGCKLHLHAAVARRRAGLLPRNLWRMGHSQRLFGAVFHALTRLRKATIKEFDTIARLKT